MRPHLPCIFTLPLFPASPKVHMTEKSEASEEIPAARQQGGLDLLRTSRALPPAVLTYHDAACKLIR